MQSEKMRRCRYSMRILTGVLIVATLSLCLTMKYDSAFDVLKSVPIIGLVVAYNIPPSDYYTPIAQFPLKKGHSNVQFICKYKGRYDIQIANVKDASLWQSRISLATEVCSDDGKPLWRSAIDDACVFAYSANDEDAYRYVYGSFSVPDEVPKNQRLRMTVVCSGQLERFLRHHPDAVVQVWKCFDK